MKARRKIEYELKRNFEKSLKNQTWIKYFEKYSIDVGTSSFKKTDLRRNGPKLQHRITSHRAIQ